MHRAEGGIGPGDRRRGDAERRVLLQDRGIAGVAHGIAGDGIVDEGRGAGDRVVAAGNVAAALPGKPHRLAAAARTGSEVARPGRSIIGADSTMRSNQRLPACASRSITAPPIECASAKCGGGQSGSTTCCTKVSTSIS